MSSSEITMQESYEWNRHDQFSTYNSTLAYYQAQACLQYAKCGSLLDMPCGDGMLTSILAPHFSKVVAVDASEAHLNKAKQLLPSADVHHSLIESFSCSSKFSTVTMINVLEHVEDPVSVLKHAYSFLEDDGVLIVQVPNANAVNRKIAVLMGTLQHETELSPYDIEIAGHRRSYTMSSFIDEFRQANLNVFATGGVFYKMLSTAQIDWFLANGLWNAGFGWGRIGEEDKDWRQKFCQACYEYGKERPEDCNVIYACVKK